MELLLDHCSQNAGIAVRGGGGGGGGGDILTRQTLTYTVYIYFLLEIWIPLGDQLPFQMQQLF